MKESQVPSTKIWRSPRRLGYSYGQCCKKGQLAKDDLRRCLIFARECQKLPIKFWIGEISCYLDGMCWVHKTKTMESVCPDRKRTLTKKGESFKSLFTAKGKEEGASGRMIRYCGSHCTQ